MQALPNKRVLIVNHENITQNWYVGNDRSMLVCNCLFRVGGAAVLLSNRCVSWVVLHVPGVGSAFSCAAPHNHASCPLWSMSR